MCVICHSQTFRTQCSIQKPLQCFKVYQITYNETNGNPLYAIKYNYQEMLKLSTVINQNFVIVYLSISNYFQGKKKCKSKRHSLLEM